jgi:hypothetical protein
MNRYRSEKKRCKIKRIEAPCCASIFCIVSTFATRQLEKFHFFVRQEIVAHCQLNFIAPNTLPDDPPESVGPAFEEPEGMGDAGHRN